MAQSIGKKLFLSVLILFSIIIAFSFVNLRSSNAAINSQINFQGKLTNPDGTNVTNGAYSIVFAIYTVSGGGSAVWSETQSTVSVNDGIFQVNLGSVTSLAGAVDFNSNSLYLGIKVGADAEMTPRVRLTSSPYAFNSEMVGGVSASGLVQIGASSAQSSASSNPGIFINKTASGNLIQLQQSGVDRFVVDNNGLVTTPSVNSTSVVDGSLSNADLANSAITITAGTGLVNGGTVNLGATVSVNVGAGSGIVVNADDITVNALVATDGLSATTSSGSGLEVLTSGVGLLQGCADNDSLRWNETTDVWSCSGVSVAPDSLNFAELSDTLSLDSATTISLGANNFIFNLDGIGDFVINDNSNSALSILDTGVITLGNSAIDQNLTIDNGTGIIGIGTSGDTNTINLGSGSDTVAIGSATGSTSITDTDWSINSAGNATLTSLNLGTGTVEGAGLVDCDSVNSRLNYDATTKKYTCGHDRGSVSIRKTADESVTSTTTMQNDDHFTFTVGASETWSFEINGTSPSLRNPGLKVAMILPAGSSSCFTIMSDGVNNNYASSAVCGATVAITGASWRAGTTTWRIAGYFTTGVTAGSAQLQWSQNTSSGTSATLNQGSMLNAYKLTGADLAENYNSTDNSIKQGMIVSLEGSSTTAVKKSSEAYKDNMLGIVSTNPGIILSDKDNMNSTMTYPIALSGRVPILISNENGVPVAGDMITTSASRNGFGMKAIRSGYVVGQALSNAIDNFDGTSTVVVFIKNGYWQAPLRFDLNSVMGSSLQNKVSLEEISAGTIVSATNQNEDINDDLYSGVDQVMIDQILNGFKVQKQEIEDLKLKISIQQTPSSITATNPQLTLDNFLKISELGGLKTVGDLEITGWLFLSSSQIGTAQLLPNQQKLVVTLNKATPDIPIVNITARSPYTGNYWVSDVTKNSFVIEFSEPQKNQVDFDWSILLRRQPKPEPQTSIIPTSQQQINAVENTTKIIN